LLIENTILTLDFLRIKTNRYFSMKIEEKIQKNVPLGPLTTLKIGGPADYFFEPVDEDEFRKAIKWSISQQLPYFVMGKGSNILVHDSGYRGLVICTGKMDKLKVMETVIVAQCGVEVDYLVDICINHSLSGLEFAAGLPGTVGGAIFMNARAYGGEFSRVVDRVKCLQVNHGEVEKTELENKELEFDYKKSLFQKKQILLLEAYIRLEKKDKHQIAKLSSHNREKRKTMGQYSYPSAGCIFKNDYNLGKPAGKIIDELGLKGTKIGDAEVFQEHANFIINRGKAKAEDVYKLIRLIEDETKNRAGVLLKREIILLGNWQDTDETRKVINK